jgi:hypothetical protein
LQWILTFRDKEYLMQLSYGSPQLKSLQLCERFDCQCRIHIL